MIGRCSGDHALARVLVLWSLHSCTGTRVRQLPTAGMSSTLIRTRGASQFTNALAMQDLGALLHRIRAGVEQHVVQHLALQLGQTSRARHN
jgi:hypothetical protein